MQGGRESLGHRKGDPKALVDGGGTEFNNYIDAILGRRDSLLSLPSHWCVNPTQ